MSIYYCDECEVYFSDSDIDNSDHGEAVHDICQENNYRELTHKEIIKELNNE